MKAPQHGQALIEYAIVCAIIILILIVGQPSLVDQLIAAIKARLASFAVLLGAP